MTESTIRVQKLGARPALTWLIAACFFGGATPSTGFAQSDGNTCPGTPTMIVDHEVGEPVEPVKPAAQVPAVVVNAQGDRYVYFAHGHAGSDVSWATAAGYVNVQSISNWVRIKRTFNKDYAAASLTGVMESAGIWDDELKSRGACEQDSVNITQNFVIAHSFGGLVSKYVYGLSVRQGFDSLNRPYNGIITFDTPHAGANFAANINQISAFVSEGCDAIIDGPIVEGILQVPLLSFFVPGILNTVEEISDGLCGGAGGVVNIALPFAVGPTQPNQNATIQDLNPGSEIISEIDTMQQVPHRIAVSSNETQEDLIWRVIYWASQDAVSNYDFGDANTDGELMVRAAEWEADYTQRSRTAAVTANDLRCRRWWRSGLISNQLCGMNQLRLNNQAAAQTLALRAAYARGVRWWQEADQRFKALGGFSRDSLIIASGTIDCSWLLAGLPGQGGALWSRIGTSTSANACRQDCETYNWPSGTTLLDSRYSGTTGRIVTQTIPNDGIVPKQSQMAWDGAAQYEYEGSNHFQIRGDRNTHHAFTRAMTLGDQDIWFQCTQP